MLFPQKVSLLALNMKKSFHRNVTQISYFVFSQLNKQEAN